MGERGARTNRYLFLQRVNSTDTIFSNFPRLLDMPLPDPEKKRGTLAFPIVSSQEEASSLLANMMVSALNPRSERIRESRFRPMVVKCGPMVQHYLEVQLNQRETADMSALDAFQHRWRTVKEMRGEALQPAASMFIAALRDSTVRPACQEFPDQLFVKDGILYYVHENTQRACIVVPPALRLKLMVIAHDIPTSNHRGAAATYRTLQRNYWWQGMRRDVYHYVSGCLKCHKAKATRRDRFGVLMRYDLCPPGHTYQIDHWGPFPPSKKGNTIALTVIDRGSGYLWAYPCPDATAETTAKTLHGDHMLENGFPVNIICDNGPAFRAKLSSELDRRVGVRRLFTTAYHPQSNGKIERPHRIFGYSMRIYVNPTQTDWDERLKPIVYATRTTVPEDSPYCPYTLWFGREPVTPIGLLSGEFDATAGESGSLNFHDALLDQMIAAEIMKKVIRAREDRAAMYNSPPELPPVWEPGQLVLVHRQVIQKDLAQKFINQWVGPFRIIQRVTPVVYRVDLANGVGQNYHVSRLHPFWPSSHPLTERFETIDLFDIDNPLETGDMVEPVDIPPVEVQVGKMVIVLVEHDLRIGKVTEVEPLSGVLRVHLYDTLTMGSASGSPARWTERHYPVYMNKDAGLVIKEDKDVTDQIPVVIRVQPRDLLDVPFDLSAGKKLNMAQAGIIAQWYRKEFYDGGLDD